MSLNIILVNAVAVVVVVVVVIVIIIFVIVTFILNRNFTALIRDCWCVAFGNSYNDEERCVLAGYDNGDIKMFDLRFNKV